MLRKKFADILKKFREDHELSQTKLAAKLDVSMQHVYNLETERSGISIELLENFAKLSGYHLVLSPDGTWKIIDCTDKKTLDKMNAFCKQIPSVDIAF